MATTLRVRSVILYTRALMCVQAVVITAISLAGMLGLSLRPVRSYLAVTPLPASTRRAGGRT